MNTETIFTSHSEADTEQLAAAVAAGLPAGGIVALYGDLGAGKTVFARGFARAVGVDEPVSSPTYTIIQEYRLPGGGDFFHLDLYRIDGPAAALAFGVDEYFERPGSYVLVEWPERIAALLPDGVVRVEIVHAGESERRIAVTKRPERPPA